MGVDILGQAVAFGQGALAGVGLGLAYDVFRALRRQFPWRWLAFVLDVAFWLGTTAAVFFFALTRGDGEIRLFHMAALLLGGGGYFLTLSRLALPVLLWLTGGLAALCRLVVAPVRLGGRRIKKFLEKRLLLLRLRVL